MKAESSTINSSGFVLVCYLMLMSTEYRQPGLTPGCGPRPGRPLDRANVGATALALLRTRRLQSSDSQPRSATAAERDEPRGVIMAIRTLLWRGLDAPRMEIVRVESLDRAHGTQIGISYELRWKLDGPVLELTMDGGPGIRVELGDADFFDLHHSAFFNSLPVARDRLLEEGATAREYTMRFVRVPELTAEPAWQRYEPLARRVMRYRSSGYEADITFDADGFVTLYQDYLERVG